MSFDEPSGFAGRNCCPNRGGGQNISFLFFFFFCCAITLSRRSSWRRPVKVFLLEPAPPTGSCFYWCYILTLIVVGITPALLTSYLKNSHDVCGKQTEHLCLPALHVIFSLPVASAAHSERSFETLGVKNLATFDVLISSCLQRLSRSQRASADTFLTLGSNLLQMTGRFTRGFIGDGTKQIKHLLDQNSKQLLQRRKLHVCLGLFSALDE